MPEQLDLSMLPDNVIREHKQAEQARKEAQQRNYVKKLTPDTAPGQDAEQTDLQNQSITKRLRNTWKNFKKR